MSRPPGSGWTIKHVHPHFDDDGHNSGNSQCLLVLGYRCPATILRQYPRPPCSSTPPDPIQRACESRSLFRFRACYHHSTHPDESTQKLWVDRSCYISPVNTSVLPVHSEQCLAALKQSIPGSMRSTSRDSSPRTSILEGWNIGLRTMLPSSSRPSSGALLSTTSRPPTLSEILSNESSPPYTLSAFMAYLSQNHCLETLEFTMEADRYRAEYNQVYQAQRGGVAEDDEYVCSLWIKLMEAYIVPCAPREVNLPCPVRDRLLSHPCSSSPPHPSQLHEAVQIVYELMNDSVLVPFLETVAATYVESQMEVDGLDRRHSRTRSRPTKETSPTRYEANRSPNFLPAVLGTRTSRSASNSTEAVDRAGLTDDTGSANSPSAAEPMTPPMTPPAPEWNPTTSPPGGLQRALNAHNSGWKKVGAKLGLGKMMKPGHIRNPASTSSAPEGDVVMGDGNADNRL